MTPELPAARDRPLGSGCAAGLCLLCRGRFIGLRAPWRPGSWSTTSSPLLDDREVLHVRSVDSQDGVHGLPERLLLPADSCSSVSPRPRMSLTDTYLCTLGSTRSTSSSCRPAGALTEPLSLERSQARLSDEDELRSATASTMERALETQAGSEKDGGGVPEAWW